MRTHHVAPYPNWSLLPPKANPRVGPQYSSNRRKSGTGVKIKNGNGDIAMLQQTTILSVNKGLQFKTPIIIIQ